MISRARRYAGTGQFRRNGRSVRAPLRSEADHLANQILFAADTQLVHGYLVADEDRFRTVGASGISALIDFVGSNNFVQATASQQPVMDVGNAPGGRDRITFDDTASQIMVQASNVSMPAGSRWGVISVEQAVSTKTVTNPRRFANGTNERLIGLRGTLNYQTGFWSGSWDFVIHAASDTNPHILEGYYSSPHAVRIDGTETLSAVTDALTPEATQPWSIGGSAAGYGYMDMHLSLFLIIRLSGTSVPSWVPTVRTLIDNYYGNQWGL